MASAGAHKRLMETAILIAAIAFFPGVVGYAWAIGWLPVYGAVCHFDKLFGPSISSDGYRVYLLGRGCDVDAAIRNILAASQFANGEDKVDANKIVDVYHGRQLAIAGDEFLAVDLVQRKLKEFTASASSGNGCARDERYCATADAGEEDFGGRWIRAYLSYVRSQFGYTAMDGADYISSLLRMGLVAQGVIALCYLAAVLFCVRHIVAVPVRDRRK